MMYLDSQAVIQNIQEIGVPVNSAVVDNRLTLTIRGKRTTVRIDDPLFRTFVHAVNDDFPTGPKADQYRADLEQLIQELIDALGDDEMSRYETNNRLAVALICDCIQHALHNRAGI